MKKLLCFILCLILTFSSVSIFTQAYEVESASLSSLEAFTQKLTQLTKEYDSDNEVSFFSTNALDKNEVSHKNSTKRLIVKAEGDIDTLNAVEHIDGYNDLHILQFNSYSDMEAALAFYEDCENVIYAQEDCVNKIAEYEVEEIIDFSGENTENNVVANAVPESIITSMYENSEKHGFPLLRKKLEKENIVYEQELTVAVIDTGVEADHELLAGRVEPTGFDAIDGVSSDDKDGHGTHVAGVIVANTLDNVTVKPYRVLNEEGEGTDAQVALGIEAAVADDVDVINMSLGRRGESEVIEEAVKKATDAGIIVVVSAGNDGVCMDSIPYTPACCDRVITVIAGGLDSNAYCGFTNYGSMCETAALGRQVVSSFIDNTYATLSGTSMAAPFVSAAATYFLLDNPETTYEEITETIDKFEANERMYVQYIFDDDVPQMSVPTFNVEPGDFNKEFYLEMFSDAEGAKIYYKLSTSSYTAWRLYEKPIKIQYTTTVTAYVGKLGAISSDEVTVTYTKTFSDEEDKYIINSSGQITEYLAPHEEGDTTLVIPDIINGVVPKSIGKEVFKNFDYLENLVLPDSVYYLNDYCFAYCDNLQYVRANGVTIANKAFVDCKNLKEFDGNKLTNIQGTFEGCRTLQFVDTRNATQIGANSFKNATGVLLVDLENINTIGNNAFENSNVRTVNIPYITQIGSGVFKNCTNLESVSIPKIKTLTNECFSGCTSLKKIEADSVTKFNGDTFTNCKSLESVNFPILDTIGNKLEKGNFYGCTSLKSFNATNLRFIGTNCFEGCTQLESLNAPLITTIRDNAFKNCTSLKSLDCTNVTSLQTDAFVGCTSLNELYFPAGITVTSNAFTTAIPIEKIIFENPTEISDLPSGVPVALPSSLTEITSSNTEDIIIYGSKGSYAESWATENGHTFIEITPETAVFNDIAPYCQSYNQELYFDIIGLNRTYLWYGNNEKSNTGGTPINPARSSKFSPDDYYKKFKYYYCVATSTDGENEPVSVTSSVCTYAQTSIMPQGSTTINFNELMLFTSDTERTQLSDIVTFGENSQYTPVPSYTTGSTDYFGTGSTFITYTDGVPDITFSIVVYGDLNGDSICDVLDCTRAERTINGYQELTGVYHNAADTDANGEVDVSDYQDIINRALK